MNTLTLGTILYSYFEQDLKLSKGLLPSSVHSYRDTIRLFLHFVAQDIHRKITRIPMSELTSDRVLRFLQFLEIQRHNHICTRNQRLAALHTFFNYLARRMPEMMGEAERVTFIPHKRVPPPQTLYLERDEIDILFSNMPKKARFALRDRTLLLFLYNTGARVQEVADLHVANLNLESQPRVHLHGKGDKWRICPLWTETGTLLKQLLKENYCNPKPDHPVFISHKGQPLTRFGIYKIVRHHTRILEKKNANGKLQKISPHTLRHTTAVHLLESGVEVNVIRAWLGHVSLDTTNRYAEINIRMKEKALETCEPPLSALEGFPRKPIWKDDQSLLNWLESL